MIIRVFLRAENPLVHRPQHCASKTLATLALAALAARWTDSQKKDAIQLTTSETWREVKDRLRKKQGKVVPINSADSYHIPVFMTSYPPKGFESDARRRQRHLWMNADRF